ncbi:hypothetical protein ACGF7U_01455 [Micromonospora sp. NPDC047670]|uniref:hypothetical protein n=1 Tax=Micromonospora sp. NPDC047670 TaxID=3364252 RepID=UPI0037247348
MNYTKENGMRRRLASTVAATTVMTALAVLGGASAAQAEPHNVGWLYAVGGGGAVFFDADLAGYPGYEKITVCDNESNGKGVQGAVYPNFDGYGAYFVKDPSNDGRCASIQGDFFPEDKGVEVWVWEYAGDNQYNHNFAFNGVS